MPIKIAKTLVNSPRLNEPYSSAKHSSAIESHSSASGRRRNAPA
jgi:hypothetical protein